MDEEENGFFIVAQALCDGLASLRESDPSTDFEVKIEDKTFACHKVVLSAVSDYFKAMFSSGMKEASENEATLENISPETFQLVLDLLYRKRSSDPLVNRTDAEIVELFRVADMLRIPCLLAVCQSYFLNTMFTQNCVERLCTGKTSAYPALHNMARKFIMDKFDSVTKEGSFQECSYDDLIDIISDDALTVSDEKCVWETISAWINYGKDETREKHLPQLLKHCCLSEIDVRYLVEEIAFNDHVHNDKEASQLVQHAILYKHHPSLQGNMELWFRQCMNKTQADVLLGSIDDEGGRIHIEIFSSDTGKWIQSVQEKGPTSGFASCAYKTSIYVCGGNGSHGQKVYEFDATNKSWYKIKGDLPVCLTNHTMVATDGFLYAISGRTGTTLSWKVFKFCMRTSSWSYHGDVVAPVERASAVQFKVKFYIVGGLTEDGEPLQVIQEYDIKTQSCTIIADLPSPCPYSHSVLRNGLVYMVTINGQVLRFEVSSGKVEVITTVENYEPDYLGVALRNNQLKLFGVKSVDPLASDEEEIAVLDVEDDTTFVDINSGAVSQGRIGYSSMNIVNCVNVVVHWTQKNSGDRSKPPAVPPRNYQT